jgi:ribose-phosphate pyrophosphokinase
MTIQLTVDNVNVPVKHIKFSDGSSSVKLCPPENFKPSAYYSISVDPTTRVDDYLWEIALVADAIRKLWPKGFKKKLLHLPYLPHARADRVFEEGNPLPLGVFFLHLHAAYFDQIFLTDPHSMKYLGYNFDVSVKPQDICFWEAVGHNITDGSVLVAPDNGALSKIYLVQKQLAKRGIDTQVIEAGKKRDIETGRVLETTLPDVDLHGKNCWIVDDIADGGGTFIPLASKLKEAGAKEVNLYVTHGIFAKGLLPFKGIIDKIFTYQTIGTYVNRIDIDNFNRGII